MRQYIATAVGEQIAQESGLSALTERIINEDYDKPLFILTQLSKENPGYIVPFEEEIDGETRRVRSLLKTIDEQVLFDRGLSIEPDTDTWRRVGNLEENTLFPVREILPYALANEEDGLVLSGAAGLSLLNFRGRCHLLARSRFEEYGFRTFNESCAFIGAYVVEKTVEADSYRFRDKAPSFSYIQDGVMHTISVGGSFHGDFQMKERQIPQTGILSPINTHTEFGPQKSLNVVGYHSVEPDVAATLIEAEYLQSGKEAARQLVADLIDVIYQTRATNPRDANETPFVFPAFGDFGDGDVMISLTSLRLLISHSDFNPLIRNGRLHSTPYAPQSSAMFEIVPIDGGVKFMNRNKDYDEDVPGIVISRESYQKFFQALLGQTSSGLGRTSPSQLIELVFAARDLLENNLDRF